MSIPAKTATLAAKTTQTGEKAPQIVPNAPAVVQNPVPATERDTPVLIQYSAPEPAVVAPAPITVAPEVRATTAAVAEKAADLLQAMAAASTETVPTTALRTVRMLKNHPKVGAFKGTTTKLPAALAAELITSEFAVAAADIEGVTETSGYTETI